MGGVMGTDVVVSVMWMAFPGAQNDGFWAAGLKIGDEYHEADHFLARTYFKGLAEDQLSEVYTKAVEALKTLGIDRFTFVVSPRNG
jgi:hypothetical protein